MNNVVRPNFNRRIAPFVAEVSFDAESGVWVAVCDALSVCTEAPNYETVTARFWEIAPEIAAANGINFNADSRIEFRHIEDAASRIAM